MPVAGFPAVGESREAQPHKTNTKEETKRSPLLFLQVGRDSKNINAICRWHIAAASANTGGYID